MKTACLAACFGLLAMTFTGCALGPKAPFEPTQALFFTSTSAPLSTDFASTSVTNLRRGTASTNNLFGLFAFGDCSIKEAAEEGGLDTIEFADYSNFNLFGIYQSTTVTVYGK